MNEIAKKQEEQEIENRHRLAIHSAQLEYKKIYDNIIDETK